MEPVRRTPALDADLLGVLAEIDRITARDPREGEVVGGRYRLVRLLAQGGMGRVYVAEHVELGTPLAVKLLPVDAADEQRVARFRREAIAAAQLRSPHVVSVHDFGRTLDGAFYLVMELLEGRDLGALLAREGLPGAARTLDLLRQIARALDHAHGHGIVHRDLKPENVFVVEGSCYPDYVKVLDFGVAKSVLAGSGALTAVGTVLGTPAYMAPEQALGDPERVGPPCDRYALAAVALELLTGATPYPYESATETLEALVAERPRMPSALGLRAPGLDELFERALARDPGARFVSASGFVEALARVLGDAALEGAPEPSAPRASMIRALAPRAARVPSEAVTMIGLASEPRPTPPLAATPASSAPALEPHAAPPERAPGRAVPPIPTEVPLVRAREGAPARRTERAALRASVAALLVAIAATALAIGWLLGAALGLPAL